MHTNPIDSATETVDERVVVRPPVDIFESGDELLLIADMPGLSPDSLRVDIDDKTLTIGGTRAAGVPTGARIAAGQASAFDYKRAFELPDAIDPSRIRATYRAGVLELHLPRHERARPRRIAIDAA